MKRATSPTPPSPSDFFPETSPREIFADIPAAPMGDQHIAYAGHPDYCEDEEYCTDLQDDDTDHPEAIRAIVAIVRKQGAIKPGRLCTHLTLKLGLTYREGATAIRAAKRLRIVERKPCKGGARLALADNVATLPDVEDDPTAWPERHARLVAIYATTTGKAYIFTASGQIDITIDTDFAHSVRYLIATNGRHVVKWCWPVFAQLADIADYRPSRCALPEGLQRFPTGFDIVDDLKEIKRVS